MIGYIVILIIVSIIVSVLTEQMLIRRLNLEEGIIVSKGKCILKPGYGLLQKQTEQFTKVNSLMDNSLENFYKPLK